MVHCTVSERSPTWKMASSATETQYQLPLQQPEAGGEKEDADDENENDDSLIIVYLSLRFTTVQATASQERRQSL
jgi:hypothetical protein